MTWNGIPGPHSIFSTALPTMKFTALRSFWSCCRPLSKALNFHTSLDKQGICIQQPALRTSSSQSRRLRMAGSKMFYWCLHRFAVSAYTRRSALRFFLHYGIDWIKWYTLALHIRHKDSSGHHVKTSKCYLSQPAELQVSHTRRANIHTDAHGDTVMVIDKLLAKCKQGTGYQFLALPMDAPVQEAGWQPTRKFFDPGGTLTTMFHTYIRDKGIVSLLHWR